MKALGMFLSVDSVYSASSAFLLLTLLLLSAAAQAQQDIPRENPITWSMDSAGGAVKPGAEIKAQVTARIEEGWHLYALELPHEGPRPTRITVPAGQNFTLSGKIDAPAPLRAMDPNFGFETDYYELETTFAVPVRVAPTTEPGKHKLSVQVRFQTCNQEICLPPKTLKLDAEVEVGE